MTLQRRINPRLLWNDSTWFAMAVVLAFGMGVMVDQTVRSTPLGLSYKPTAEIVVRAVASQESGAELIRVVSVEEVEEMLIQLDVITLDARPREIFDLGHVPGALSVSRERFAADFEAVAQLLRAPGKTIIVYCADITCEDGAIVAKWLQENGVSRPLVYGGGFHEWESSGRPVNSNL